MFNLFSNLRATRPWKICQKRPGTEFQIAPATTPGSSTEKAAGSYEWHTRSLSAPTAPKAAKSESSQQPVILKLSHSTTQKAATHFPFPRGDSKRRETHVALCISERTWRYSHTNSNIDEMPVPSSSHPFQVDPAQSWNNFPSFSQSFHSLFHWLGQSLHPPHAKPGFTYVTTASIKIVGFFSEFLSLFWSQQRKDTYEIAKWLPPSMYSG